MRFWCPNCGRDEEILLDRKPWCLFCHIEMIGATDYSKVWMSPCFAITRMRTIVETYGIKLARTDRRFKKEREAGTTALLALALSKLYGETLYIEIETVDNTPDTRLHSLDQSSGHNTIQTRSIEIVDWEENVPDIMEVIKKKCSRAYPDYYSLVVHARHIGKVLNFANISEEIKTIHSPFMDIWAIASAGADNLKVACLAPEFLEIDLRYSAEFEAAKKQRELVKKGIRGTTPGFYELGPSFLPIP
jgi:hypothetical protein